MRRSLVITPSATLEREVRCGDGSRGFSESQIKPNPGLLKLGLLPLRKHDHVKLGNRPHPHPLRQTHNHLCPQALVGSPQRALHLPAQRPLQAMHSQVLAKRLVCDGLGQDLTSMP